MFSLSTDYNMEQLPVETLQYLASSLDVKSQCQLSVCSSTIRNSLSHKSLIWFRCRKVYVESEEYISYRKNKPGWTKASWEGPIKYNTEWIPIVYGLIFVDMCRVPLDRGMFEVGLALLKANNHKWVDFCNAVEPIGLALTEATGSPAWAYEFYTLIGINVSPESPRAALSTLPTFP